MKLKIISQNKNKKKLKKEEKHKEIDIITKNNKDNNKLKPHKLLIMIMMNQYNLERKIDY